MSNEAFDKPIDRGDTSISWQINQRIEHRQRYKETKRMEHIRANRHVARVPRIERDERRNEILQHRG